jgi:hypothetical protein
MKIVKKTFSAGFRVQIDGLPFFLVSDTEIEGPESNFGLIDQSLLGSDNRFSPAQSADISQEIKEIKSTLRWHFGGGLAIGAFLLLLLITFFHQTDNKFDSKFESINGDIKSINNSITDSTISINEKLSAISAQLTIIQNKYDDNP